MSADDGGFGISSSDDDGAKKPDGSAPKKRPTDGAPDGRPRVSLPSNMEPTYYIGGGNGNALIEEVLNGMGWKRSRDKADDGYRLKWCELKSSINYNTFKEGDQMVNHIPNCNLLTNKLGLLNSLQEYSRVCNSVQKRAMKLDFIPETYRLDDPKDRETFVEVYKDREIWICKPTGKNQGKGIFLVRSLAELKQAIADTEEGSQQSQQQQQGKPQKPLNRIIQRYITNPLLIEGRKFDIRCYMLVASTVPHLVVYHKGYLRLSMYEYDNDCDNIIAHLTNQFIQKKDPKYQDVKEETAWSMDRFNEYVNEKLAPVKGLEEDWVYNTLTNTMKQIMTHCFMAVKHRLACKVGYFDLYGLDFMIDEDMKIWLIEVNVNPCLATNCEALAEIVPGVVRESLYLSVECFEKARKGRPLLPLQSLREFQILYNGSPKTAATSNPRTSTSPTRHQPSAGLSKSEQPKTQSTSPVRRVRSLSPVKEAPAQRDGKAAKQSPSTSSSSTGIAKGASTLTAPDARGSSKDKEKKTSKERVEDGEMTAGSRMRENEAGDSEEDQFGFQEKPKKKKVPTATLR